MGRQRGGHRAQGRGAIRVPYTIPLSARCVVLCVLVLALAMVPAGAETAAGSPLQQNHTPPQKIVLSNYVVDFNRVDVGAGTVGVDFYLNLKSDSPVSINDIELMNGMFTSVSTVVDTPNEKEYRIIAILTAEPDLSRYPFDRHTLTIRLEPKLKNENELILVIDPNTTGIDDDADIPGWKITGTQYYVVNHSYLVSDTPYSRAVFDYGISRDEMSTLLKFFLPLMLIVLVSLGSLLMKTTSRLGLNASMFLAAVLIHWRVADAIPGVTYATFLDLFMIITYGTLVMVLFSGILAMKYSEDHNTAATDRINYWSIRLIPPLCIILYCVLFLTLLF